MIIDYDGRPQESIFYDAALLYYRLKEGGDSLEEAHAYFEKNISSNALLFYYSLDWLFLLGKIKTEESGEVVLCG